MNVYKGELIIMTTDQGEDDVLTAVRTVPGNHERNHYSQRQVDVIIKMYGGAKSLDRIANTKYDTTYNADRSY